MKTIYTNDAPKAIGPYSQGIIFKDLIFLSGQIPLTPSGEFVNGDIKAQARQALNNVAAVLKSANSSMDHVIKVSVFLKNMDDFTAFNEVYAEYFTTNLPARSAIEVSRLPRNSLVEIECVACKP